MPLAFVRGVDLLQRRHGDGPLRGRDHRSDGRQAAPTLNRSTNGLASGNTEEEAVFHALCELVERDATTLYRARKGTSRPIEWPSIESPVVLELIAQDQRRGVRPLAHRPDIGPRHSHRPGGHRRSHPRLFPPLRSRDRLRLPPDRRARPDPRDHRGRANPRYQHRRLARRLRARGIRHGAPPRAHRWAARRRRSLRSHCPRAARSARRSQRCSISSSSGSQPRGVSDVTMVRMGGERYGISVVRVFAPDLEDKAANRTGGPGKRYLRAMMSAR